MRCVYVGLRNVIVYLHKSLILLYKNLYYITFLFVYKVPLIPTSTRHRFICRSFNYPICIFFKLILSVANKEREKNKKQS